MKPSRMIRGKTGSNDPGRRPASNEGEGNTTAKDSYNLSPERITDGVSTTTHVLNDILAQDAYSQHWRHWGINE